MSDESIFLEFCNKNGLIVKPRVVKSFFDEYTIYDVYDRRIEISGFRPQSFRFCDKDKQKLYWWKSHIVYESEITKGMLGTPITIEDLQECFDKDTKCIVDFKKMKRKKMIEEL